MLLLSCKFTNIRAILNEAQDIEDAQKKSRTCFPDRTIGSKQFFSKFFHSSNLYEFAATSGGSTTNESSATSEGLGGNDRKSTALNWQSGLKHDITQTQSLRSSKTTIKLCFYIRGIAGHAVIQAIVGATIAVQSLKSGWI